MERYVTIADMETLINTAIMQTDWKVDNEFGESNPVFDKVRKAIIALGEKSVTIDDIALRHNYYLVRRGDQR